MRPALVGKSSSTDGIARLLREEKVLAYAFEGQHYELQHQARYLKSKTSTLRPS